MPPATGWQGVSAFADVLYRRSLLRGECAVGQAVGSRKTLDITYREGVEYLTQ